MITAAMPMVGAFKHRALRAGSGAHCQQCGVALHGGEATVHIEPPRRAVAEAFLQAPPLAPPIEFHSVPRINCKCFRPQDRRFEQAWKRYFAEHATLRLLCQRCNQQAIREWQQAMAAAGGVAESG